MKSGMRSRQRQAKRIKRQSSSANAEGGFFISKVGISWFDLKPDEVVSPYLRTRIKEFGGRRDGYVQELIYLEKYWREKPKTLHNFIARMIATIAGLYPYEAEVIRRELSSGKALEPEESDEIHRSAPFPKLPRTHFIHQRIRHYSRYRDTYRLKSLKLLEDDLYRWEVTNKRSWTLAITLSSTEKSNPLETEIIRTELQTGKAVTTRSDVKACHQRMREKQAWHRELLKKHEEEARQDGEGWIIEKTIARRKRGWKVGEDGNLI